MTPKGTCLRSAGVPDYVSGSRPLSRTGGRIYDRNIPPTRASPARVAEPFAALPNAPVYALCTAVRPRPRDDRVTGDFSAEPSAALCRAPTRDLPASPPSATPSWAEQPPGDRRPAGALLAARRLSRPDHFGHRGAEGDNRSNSKHAAPRSDRWPGVRGDIAQPMPAGKERRNAYMAVRKSGWSVKVRPHLRQRQRASQITVQITLLATM